MKTKRLIAKRQIFYLSIMFVLIFVGILVFLAYRQTIITDPKDRLGAFRGISDEDFETSIFILFVISTIFYFSVITVVTRRSHKYFIGQSALVESFLQDYDCIYYVKIYENKYDDEIESYHFSEEFLKVFNVDKAGNRFSDILRYIADTIVFSDDRERFVAETKREVILPAIENSGIYFTNFRVGRDGAFHIYQIKFSSKKNVAGRYSGMICGIRCIDNEVKAEKIFRDSFNEKLAEKTNEIKEQNLMLNKLNESIIEFLGSVIENRMLWDSDHIVNVKSLTRILAAQLAEDRPEYRLSRSKVEIITSASALHDLGKIRVPYEILYKTPPLSEEETGLLRTHTTEGGKILEIYNPGWSEIYQRTCIDICLYHHERYDGGGYPEGLAGDDIPISAQIVSVADCFDVLTSKMPYRGGFMVDEALEMIYSGECGAFNPKLMDSLRNAEASIRAFAENPAAFYNSREIVHTNYSILANINILLAEDDEPQAESMKRQLENNGASVALAQNGKLAYEMFIAEPSSYDIILMDISMPIMDGIKATSMIRSSGKSRAENIPIIALLNEVNQEQIDICRNAGMNTYITRPIIISRAASIIYESLNIQSRELQRRLSSVIRDAHRDALTGVKTKLLYFDEIKKLNESIAKGAKLDFAVAVFDLNNLKEINDNFGHSEGDCFIKNASKIICRVFDHSPVFRIGGDEFAAILTGNDYENRILLSELFSKEVAAAEKINSIKSGRTSIAHGMSSFRADADMSFNDVFNRADKELYKNKIRMKSREKRPDFLKEKNGGGGGGIYLAEETRVNRSTETSLTVRNLM